MLRTKNKGHNQFPGRDPILPCCCGKSVDGVSRKSLKTKWRKRVGVEPTGDGSTRRPPVLKTGTITGPHALPPSSFQIRVSGVKKKRGPSTRAIPYVSANAYFG